MRQLRLGLAVAGFIVALAGVLRDDRRLVWAAIAILSVSLAIRIYLQRADRAR